MYKVSRRRDLDIASFTAAVRVRLDGDTIADAAIAHGAPRRTTYIVAALAACVVSLFFGFTFVNWVGSAILGSTPAPPATEWATPGTMRIYVFTHWLLFFGAAVLLYALVRLKRRHERERGAPA